MSFLSQQNFVIQQTFFFDVILRIVSTVNWLNQVREKFQTFVTFVHLFTAVRIDWFSYIISEMRREKLRTGIHTVCDSPENFNV